jgi:hypothetical protein
MKKIILLTLISCSFLSCKKEQVVETNSEWKGSTFVRIEVVGQDSIKTYSNISHINIK